MDTSALITYINLFGTIALLFTIIFFLNYFRKIEKELQEKEKNIDQQYKDILEHGHNRIRSILEKTVEKADKMLLETEYLNHHIKEDVSHTLDKVLENNQSMLTHNADEFLKAYQLELEKVKQAYTSKMQVILEDVKTTTENEVKDYMGILLKETIDSQTFIGKKINQEFEKIQQEILAYKQQQMTKVDESINQIITRVAQDVMGKALPLDDHVDLVLSALNTAKNEGLFNQ